MLENAFKHGVEPSRVPVQVEIITSVAEHRLNLRVRNTGELRRPGSGGVGLRNGQERLRLLFGAAAHLELLQQQGWVEARVTLPLQVTPA